MGHRLRVHELTHIWQTSEHQLPPGILRFSDTAAMRSLESRSKLFESSLGSFGKPTSLPYPHEAVATAEVTSGCSKTLLKCTRIFSWPVVTCESPTRPSCNQRSILRFLCVSKSQKSKYRYFSRVLIDARRCVWSLPPGYLRLLACPSIKMFKIVGTDMVPHILSIVGLFRPSKNNSYANQGTPPDPCGGVSSRQILSKDALPPRGMSTRGTLKTNARPPRRTQHTSGGIILAHNRTASPGEIKGDGSQNNTQLSNPPCEANSCESVLHAALTL